MRFPRTDGFLIAGAMALGGLPGACSCGDDGDMAVVDGAPEVDAPIDGPEITQTRAGQVTLTQLSLVDDNTDVNDLAISGASFEVAYDDLTTLGVSPSVDEGSNGCTVFEFSGPGMEADEVDEGPVAITGFASIGDINCAFVNADVGYQCAPAADASATVTMNSTLGGPDGNGVSSFAISNGAVEFTTVNGSSRGALGMSITFPDGTWPINSANNGTFPVLNVINAGTIALLHPGATAETLAADTMDYSLTVGEGPIQGGYHLFEEDNGNMANGPFMVSGGSDESGAIDAFDQEITPAVATDGELVVNFANGDPFNVDQLPDTEFTISCDVASGGNCESGSPVSALIVEGRTTDGTLADTGGADPLTDETDFPEPVGTYTTFRCVFNGQKTATISQDALDAILAGSPTRIETRVMYVSGAFLAEDDEDEVELLSGYGLLGYTTL